MCIVIYHFKSLELKFNPFTKAIYSFQLPFYKEFCHQMSFHQSKHISESSGMCIVIYYLKRIDTKSNPITKPYIIYILGGFKNTKVWIFKKHITFPGCILLPEHKYVRVEHFDPGKWEFWPCVVFVILRGTWKLALLAIVLSSNELPSEQMHFSVIWDVHRHLYIK